MYPAVWRQTLAWSLVLLSCHACLAQLPQLISINGTRLSDRRFDGQEIYGQIELQSIDGSWTRALSPNQFGAISDKTGNVLCRSMGYGPYRGIYGGNYNYHGNSYYSNYVNMAAVNCTGNESAIAFCSVSHRLSFNAYGQSGLWIKCAESKCRNNNGGCSQICYDNPISESEGCGCRSGYALAPGNSTLCIDVDECLIHNGGCSHGCINTIGSRRCACPTYMSWNEHTEKCSGTALSLQCDSDRMTVSFLKEAYPMLSPEEVTLLGDECLPEDNKTHIIFNTKYDSCMTVQSEDSRGIKYRNAVVSKGSVRKNAVIRFAATVNMPFTCIIGRRSSSTASLRTVPITFVTASASVGSSNIKIQLCYDINCTATAQNRNIREGTVLYAELALDAQDVDLKFAVKKCSTRPQDSMEMTSVDLITDGLPTADWVKIIDSSGQPKFLFRYTAFTFIGYDGIVVLECHAMLQTSTSVVAEKAPPLSLEKSTTSQLAVSESKGTRNGSSISRNSEIKKTLISSCAEASSDGTYMVIVGKKAIAVWCDVKSDDGPWLTIMRRNNSRLNFNRTWNEYATGFGSLDKEFWLGNENLHAITKSQEVTLQITLTTFNNVSKYAEYSGVRVGPASDGYSLSLGHYTGTAGDMRNTSRCFEKVEVKRPVKFSTYDVDNDGLSDYTCAGRGGGWWYHDCVCTCLTCGPSTSRQILSRIGMVYYQFNDFFVLKKAEMKIRFGPPKAVSPISVTVNASSVACDSRNMVISLERETFDGPSPEHFIVHSDSFLQQTVNESHILLNFTLRAMDTLRRENNDSISYLKSVVATTASARTYYRRINITARCTFNKAMSLMTAHKVKEDHVQFELAEDGRYQVKLVMSKDEKFTELLDNLTGTSEGETIYVRVMPVTKQDDLQLALLSCYHGGASTLSKEYQIINESCSLEKDVQILTQDTFVMRLPSYLHDDHGTRIFCDVQVCTSEDDSCDAACGKVAIRKGYAARSARNTRVYATLHRKK